jgi:hypothetical protein
VEPEPAGQPRALAIGQGVPSGVQGVQVGSRNVQVNIFGEPGAAAKPARRPAYLAQVRSIAPPDLAGRDAELAELADFCTGAGTESYAWWQAEAWAGKSALLSTFVLSPPSQLAGRVEIVSFFITSRLAGRDTREDFCEVLVEQLAGLTGDDLPAALPQEAREAWLPDLLGEAARRCQEDGRRLVLVVDGLDEDQSGSNGPRPRSIAGLLPGDPPAGMRVIVAGRPSPPIPDDVPDWHPLRSAAVIRPLAPSPHAGNTRRLAREEIRALLKAEGTGRDVVGLLAAARGGLSAADLHKLTGVPRWEVEAILDGAAGRALSRRPGRTPGGGPDVYLLGHEELQAAAADYLSGEMGSYRGRLHEWADLYRSLGWPGETPEYLLSGYFRLLTALDDVPRIIAVSSDRARHDRMLDLTGNDTSALAEARAALDVIAAQDAPDLAAALVIAFHRDCLTRRNVDIPVRLPALWAALGQPGRALALIETLSSPYRAAQATARVAGSLAEAGHYDRAVEAARSVALPGLQAEGLCRVARVLAAAGQYQEAEAAAGYVDEPGWRAEALSRVAVVLAGAGQSRQAEAIARSLYRPDWQAEALTRVAGAMGAAGEHERARNVAEEILAAARARVGETQPAALAGAARALAGARQYQQAEAVAGESLSIPGRRQRETVLAAAMALAVAGRHERAAALCSRAGQPGYGSVLKSLTAAGQYQEAQRIAAQVAAVIRDSADMSARQHELVPLARTLARAGQYDEAEEIARHVTNPRDRAEALAEVAGALARAGHYQRGEDAARMIEEPEWRADALTRVAQELARAGRHCWAEAIAGETQAVAQQAAHSYREEWDLAALAAVLAEAALHRAAETVAGLITEPQERAEALAGVAAALARTGDRRRAAAAASSALAAARTVTDPYQQARALAHVAGALAAAGQYRRARAVALLIMPEWPGEWQAEAFARISEALATAGKRRQAAAAARAITIGPIGLGASQARVAGALSWAGLQLSAQAVIDATLLREEQAEGLARIAAAYAGRGLDREAERAARQAVAVAKSAAESPSLLAGILVTAAGLLARAGQHPQAETLARSIPDPGQQAAALASVAVAVSQAGEHQRAEGLARSITMPGPRSEALASVLARAGDPGAARRAAASACAAGYWATGARPVLLLDPGAFDGLARALSETRQLQLPVPGQAD